MLLPTSAYLHIPFCRRRCYYCDFPITPIGDRATPETSPMIAEYTDRLLQEIRHFSPIDPDPVRARLAVPLKTISFGGGTPSLLPPAQIDRILQTLQTHYGFAETLEISMEIDPGTFDRARLQQWKALGINRYSLGIQSIHDAHLETLGRSHRHRDNLQAIAYLHGAGIVNFSLDLISGIPHLTPEDWDDSLTWAIDSGAPHLSTYDLTIEPGTVFGKRAEKGTLPELPEETTAQMYRHASDRLTAAGYDHYEISNHAKPGHQSQHNLTYWHNQPFYGFGMGATSYLNGDRHARPRTRDAYYTWLQTLPNSQFSILNSQSPPDRLLETLMTGLRLQTGLCLPALFQDYGSQLIDRTLATLKRYEKSGWIDITDDRICLTRPEGYLFSNIILIDLFKTLDP